LTLLADRDTRNMVVRTMILTVVMCVNLGAVGSAAEVTVPLSNTHGVTYF